MVKVFHNPNFSKCAFISDDKLPQQVRGEQLELVEEIDTDDLDEAFNMTNEKDKSRETSIGDVMELDGVQFVISTMGFEQLF